MPPPPCKYCGRAYLAGGVLTKGFQSVSCCEHCLNAVAVRVFKSRKDIPFFEEVFNGPK